MSKPETDQCKTNFIDEYTFERLYRRPFDARLPTPHDLFQLSKQDPVIHTYLDAWCNGQCSWEAALIGIICAQKQVNNKLMEHAVAVMDHGNTRIFVTSGQEAGSSQRDNTRGEDEARHAITTRDMKLLAQHGRTLIVEARPDFLCERWYDWIIVAVNHKRLSELIAEGNQPLKE